MSNWIKWDGGECPVEKGVLVDVEYRNGVVLYRRPANTRIKGLEASGCFWHNENSNHDIVAYRLSEEDENISEDSVPEGWNRYDGKGMPVDGNVIVRAWLYGQDEEDALRDCQVAPASQWYWKWHEEAAGCVDIIYWKLEEEAYKVDKAAPVKSDGGSSGYYKITIKNELGEEFHCETNDVLYAFVGGDFSLGNVIKAARRMYETSQGRGKDGTSIQYDANKIKYFADDFAKRFGNA